MSRRDVERRKFRRALVPGLVFSAVAHAVLLGMGGFGIPAWEGTETDRTRKERAEEWTERSLEVVALRPRAAATAAGPDGGASPRARPAERTEVSAPPAAMKVTSAPALTTEPVKAPSTIVTVETERTKERLSASDLAALFPGRGEMPKATSRAAREASGDSRSAGDRFRGVRGTRRAGPRGGGCVVRPGTAINRRFPEGITIGGS